MIRPAMLRAAARPIASSTRITVMPLRWASTTKAPTTSSAPPSSIAQAGLRPGEEIDPQLDGYPQLPYVSDQTRSPRGWWDNQMRRNYNEPLHEEADVLGMWGPDVQPVTPLQALGQLTIAFSVLGALCLIIYQIQFEPNFVRRSFPYNGLEQQLGGFPARVEQDSEDEE